MAVDLFLYLTFAAFAAFGAVVRAMLGIYKAYNTFPDFKIEWRRILFEIFASIFFGTFGVIALKELGWFEFALTFTAMFAGLLGADTIKLITKRFGLTKGLEVTVSRQQMQNADLNDREVRAMEYVKRYGKLTNSIYQKVNFVSHDIAKRDLATLVTKGKLQKVGSNRNIQYVERRPGNLRVVSGTPKIYARKMPHKAPSGRFAGFNSRFGPQKRYLQNLKIGRQKVPAHKTPSRAQ